MRKPFLETLTKLAEKDPRIILIIGDVGFRFVEEFKERFPKQFLNVGVLEQSMMGIAAGMARMGWKPYVYTMRNFIAFRPYEQVRNDIAFGNANVKLFGVSGSAAYKFLGFSHNVIRDEDGKLDDEDVTMFKRLPNMNVHQPKTEEECSELIEKEYNRIGPAYFVI
jgi:transketolase